MRASIMNSRGHGLKQLHSFFMVADLLRSTFRTAMSSEAAQQIRNVTLSNLA